MSEYEFGDKGWAWNDDKSKAVKVKYIRYDGRGDDKNNHQCLLIKEDLDKWFKNFSLEKPCSFGVGDVVEDNVNGLIVTITDTHVNNGSDIEYYQDEEKRTGYLSFNDAKSLTLLYTAEQLDDEANYVVVESYLDSIKEAYKKHNATIQCKLWDEKEDKWLNVNLRNKPSWGKSIHYRVDPDWKPEVDKFAELKEAHASGVVIQALVCRPTRKPFWENINNPIWVEGTEYRVKPEPKQPQIDGFSLVEIVIDQICGFGISSNEELEGMNISDVINLKNFAGFYYKEEPNVIYTHPVLYCETGGHLFSSFDTSIHNLDVVRPTHVAFTKEAK